MQPSTIKELQVGDEIMVPHAGNWIAFPSMLRFVGMICVVFYIRSDHVGAKTPKNEAFEFNDHEWPFVFINRPSAPLISMGYFDPPFKVEPLPKGYSEHDVAKAKAAIESFVRRTYREWPHNQQIRYDLFTDRIEAKWVQAD